LLRFALTDGWCYVNLKSSSFSGRAPRLSVMEFGVLWKFVEKPLNWISGSLYERYKRYAVQRDIRRSAGRKIAVLLAKIDGDNNHSHRRTLAETIRREFRDAVEITRW